MTAIKRIIPVCLLFFFQLFNGVMPVAAQETSKKEAGEYFSMEDYRAALQEYLLLLREDPDNEKYLTRIAACYLESTVEDKAGAIPYLEKLLENPNHDSETLYQLGRAYHQANRFDDAIKTFKKFSISSGNDKLLDQATRFIEMCYTAKELVKYPLNVEITNLGKGINSPEPDYYPFVDEEESFLLFNTRRQTGNSGYLMMDGFWSADIFICKDKKGKWTKARSLGPPVCSGMDEEIVGLSPDGKYLFINLDTYEISGDILFATKKGKNYQKPAPLGETINTGDVEVTASVTEDKNVLYYAAVRNDGFGGADIYVSRRLPTGDWGESQNAGEVINTEYDEYFPQISKDGKTMYFASQGHSSMGGFDIFKTTWNEQAGSWSTPVNIGYPINTPGDDMNISFTRSGRTAYLSSLRKGGVGNLDIYSVTFNDVEPDHTLIRGVVLTNVPIDYNEYMTFYVYEKDGLVRRFVDEFQPPDTSWVFKETQKKVIKPGTGYSTSIVCKVDGEEKRFSLSKYPKDDPSYEFVDIKHVLIPLKNYKPPPKKRPKTTKRIIPDAFITVNEKETGDLFGNYLPVPSVARYVMILPPGRYEMIVEADGYKTLVQEISVVGKSSFMTEIVRDIVLESKDASAPLHYSKLKK